MRSPILAAAALLCLAVAGSAAATGTDADGLDLGKFKGKVVLVDFWASWCAPCRLSFPYLERMQRAYGKDGLVVVAVNVDHARDRADQFLNGVDHDFRVVYDPKSTIVGKYKITDMPTSILFDRAGTIKFTHRGFFQEKSDEYESHILSLVSAK